MLSQRHDCTSPTPIPVVYIDSTHVTSLSTARWLGDGTAMEHLITSPIIPALVSRRGQVATWNHLRLVSEHRNDVGLSAPSHILTAGQVGRSSCCQNGHLLS